MVITIVYDGYVRSLAILPYSVFITNSVAGSLELPADLVPVFTLDRLGRRWTLMLALGCAGLAGIATGLVPHSKLLLYKAVSCGYLCLSLLRLGNDDDGPGHGQPLLYHNRHEHGHPVHGGADPDPVARPGDGRCSHHRPRRHFFRSVHPLSGMKLRHVRLRPITWNCVLFLCCTKSTYSNTLPYIVLGSLSAFGGLVCLLLPETANENLPESVADAEMFGATQSFFHMPCLAKYKLLSAGIQRFHLLFSVQQAPEQSRIHQQCWHWETGGCRAGKRSFWSAHNASVWNDSTLTVQSADFLNSFYSTAQSATRGIWPERAPASNSFLFFWYVSFPPPHKCQIYQRKWL